MRRIYSIVRFILAVVFLSVLTQPNSINAQCGPSVPSHTADLSSSPSATWISPSIQRDDTCCGATNPDKCLKFTIMLHQKAMGINFQIASGAVPPGALFYQIGCGPPIAVGAPICLTGPGPHILTFCKPGNNTNTYAITSIPEPDIPDSVMVRSGCQQTLTATGFSVPTIQWTSVPSNTLHNSYLSCVSGCSNVIVTPTGTPPPFVDYEVSGFGQAPCQAAFYRDTVRVYFYSDLAATITPTNPTLCFGQSNAVLTATASGGLGPYTYTWSNAAVSESVMVGPGQYTVFVNDKTNCPPTTATVQVTSFTLPISANAGPDITLCKSSPTAALSGTVVAAGGGVWSGGTGSFVPSATVLNTSYIPSPAEISTGSVQLILTTTGNSGCPPAQDAVVLFYQNLPAVSAGVDRTVCANNSITSLSTTVSGYSANVIWSSLGTGTLVSTTSTNTAYLPSVNDISTGSVNIVVTTTNNGFCPAAGDTVKIVITPAPQVNAGTDQTVCSTSQAILNGAVSGGATTGIWTTSGSGSFNPGNTVLNGSYTPSALDITTGTVNLILTSTNFGNCFLVRDTVKISFHQQATVTAAPSKSICVTTPTIALSGTVIGSSPTGSWITGGTGSFNNVTSLTPSYSISGIDALFGFVNFTLTSTNNGPCPAAISTTTVFLQSLPTVTAGLSNPPVCSSSGSITLNGLTSTGTGSWSSSGSGVISNVSSLNTSYSMTANDFTGGLVTFTLTSTGNGTCPAVSDTMSIRVVRQPSLSILSSTAVCSTQNSIALTGSINGGVTNAIAWASSGNGVFLPNFTSSAVAYVFSSNDVTNGTVTFTLSPTNFAPCPLTTSTVQVAISTQATVNAGSNIPACSSQTFIPLNATFLAGTTGTWAASGPGTIPTPSNPNANYPITPNDVAFGSVTFSFTSTNNGACPFSRDTVRIRIVGHPSVVIGSGLAACSNQTAVVLTGTILGGNNNSGVWSTNSLPATFIPGPTSLNTSYVIKPADVVNGFVSFTLSPTNYSPCPLTTSSVQVPVVKQPTAVPGPNNPICSTQPLINLNGSVLGGSTGTGSWTTSGGGNIANVTNLNTTYSVTAADIINGSVTFSLTTTNNGPCAFSRNSINVPIIKAPQVNAGPVILACSSMNTVALSATVTGGGNSGTWTHDGSGVLTPGPNVLNPVYQMSGGDIANGAVNFTFSSTNSAPCAEVKDSMQLNIKTPAIVNAGTYTNICTSQPTIQLNGSVIGSSGTGTWSSSGSGTFVNNGNLNTTYSLSAGDKLTGQITFSLTSTNNGGCAPISSGAQLTIQQLPVVLAGSDQTICSTQPGILLNGNISGATNTGSWSTNGGGNISQITNMNATYSITPVDIAQGTVLFGLGSTNNTVCPQVRDTMKLIIIRYPTLSMELDTTLCEKQLPVRINAYITGGSGAIQWSSTGTGKFDPPDAYTTFYTASQADIQSGDIHITLSSVNNGPCGNAGISQKLTVLPSPKADFEPSAYNVTLPAPPIIFNNTTEGGKNFLWNFGDNSPGSKLISPSHPYTTAGYYTITLIAMNQYGCMDTTQKVITIVSDVLFPNAFTPNPGGSNGGAYVQGDYSNDVFFPYTTGVIEYDMKIFNRWGELIFTTNDIHVGWDGYFNGKLCQQDAYVWKAYIKFFDGREFSKTGSVTLLR